MGEECTLSDGAGCDTQRGLGSVLRRHLLPPSDGSRYRQIALELGADGELTLNAHEMGAGLEASWGVDDHEVTLRIPPEAIGRLVFALLAQQLEGRKDGVEHLLAICEQFRVEHQLACWT